MAELHSSKVCNNRELHSQKSCNCYATTDATATQPNALKACALEVLRRNSKRNNNATTQKILCNNQCNNQPKVASRVALVADDNQPHDLHRLVGEVLAEVDRLGRPWPRNFFEMLPSEIRDHIIMLRREIDEVALVGDLEKLKCKLDQWKTLMLERRTLH